jgi:hypothetical protein
VVAPGVSNGSHKFKFKDLFLENSKQGVCDESGRQFSVTVHVREQGIGHFNFAGKCLSLFWATYKEIQGRQEVGDSSMFLF